MLKNILDLFNGAMRPGAGRDERQALQLATAALLIEAARIDEHIGPREREVVLHAVREKFGLAPAQAEELVALAEAEMREAADYYQFTSLINRAFSPEQKERIIELMWQVAYADAALSAHELHLMRKIAALLHVPDSVYIAAKMRAKAASGAA